MARRRFFVENIQRGHAQIDGDQAHHLTRVLRVEPGQKFEISDNRRVFLAEVETARKDRVSFAILEEIAALPPPVHTRLFAALIKFERFEWMIEKATELGVAALIPVETARSEKGLERAARKRLARWARIAREASEQSRRARLPIIEPPIGLADAASDGSNYRFVLEEAEAPGFLSILPATRTPSDRVSILVGPEGGWTEEERRQITATGWRAVSLGANILRAETAAIAALAIVNAAWSEPGCQARAI